MRDQMQINLKTIIVTFSDLNILKQDTASKVIMEI
jgi:hypothetical protein